MRLHPRRLALLVLSLLLVLPYQAAAIEILQLTGGSVTFNDAQLPHLGAMAAHGPRVAITARFQAIGGSGFPGFKGCRGEPEICQPGETIQVGGEWSGGDFLGHGLLGTVTLDGITHTGEVGACCFDDGLFMTLTGTVLIPDFGNIASVVLTAPFTLDGLLVRTSEPPFPNMFPDTTLYALHGQGDFLLALHRQKTGDFDAWRWDGVSVGADSRARHAPALGHRGRGARPGPLGQTAALRVVGCRSDMRGLGVDDVRLGPGPPPDRSGAKVDDPSPARRARSSPPDWKESRGSGRTP